MLFSLAEVSSVPSGYLVKYVETGSEALLELAGSEVSSALACSEASSALACSEVSSDLTGYGVTSALAGSGSLTVFHGFEVQFGSSTFSDFFEAVSSALAALGASSPKDVDGCGLAEHNQLLAD